MGDDLREGKPTELVAWALANATPTQARLLGSIGDPELTRSQVGDLVEVLHDTGAVRQNEAEIGRLVGEASSVLAELPFTGEARQALTALAAFVADRTV